MAVPTIDRGAKTAPHAAMPRLMTLWVIAPAALGLVVAGSVAFDAWIGGSLLGPGLARVVHFPVTAFLLVLLFGAALALRYGGTAFAHRQMALATLLVAPCFLTGFNFGPLDPSDAAFILVFLLLLASWLVEHSRVRHDGVAMTLILIMAAFAFASIINGRTQSILKIHTLLTKFMLFFLVFNVIIDKDKLNYALKIFLYLATISAAVAIFSEIVYMATGYGFTLENTEEYKFKDTPLGRMLRTTAFLPTTQGLSHVLILGTCLALFRPMSLWRRVTIVGVLGAGTATTFSTGGYITMAVVLALAPFMAFPNRSLQWATGFAAVAVIGHISGGLNWILTNLIEPLGSRNATERVEFIRVGIEAVERQPWLGYGVKNIGRILDQPVHNAYVQSASDLGLLGALAFVGLLLYLFIRGIQSAHRASEPAVSATMKGLSLGIAGMAVQFMTEPFYDNTASWMFMGLVAAAASIYASQFLLDRARATA